MSQVRSVESNTKVSEINSILEEDGCVVIKNMLSQEGLYNLRRDLRPHLNKTPNCSGDFYGYKTKRVSSLIEKSPACREMAINETILSVMDNFLLPSCSDYQLNLTQAIQIGPGEPLQAMHPDDPMFPFPFSGEKMINCMWAVDDFTEENGATNLVPGSHKWPRVNLMPDRIPEKEEITQGIMSAGSVLIYLGSLLHCGGANRSLSPRTGLVMSYNLGWLRQSENQYLAVSQDLAKTLPERLQRLLGYFVHQPNLGQVEGRDPINLLQDKNIVDSGFEEFLPEAVKELLRDYKKQHQIAA